MSNQAFAADQLRSFVERVERLEEEKAALGTDITEIYKDAKNCGFDTKIMREVVKLRKMDRADRTEHEAILELYKSALGMLADTPLGEAAMRAHDVASPRARKAVKSLERQTDGPAGEGSAL